MNKGQVYRYFLKKEEIFYTSLDEKPSLKKFYNADAKILIRRVINRQDRLMATIYNQKLVFKKDINPFIVDPKWNFKFLLAILNSKLISYLYVNTSTIATKDDFRQTTLAELRRLPIRKTDFSNAHEKFIHDKILTFVDRMLDLNVELDKAKTPHIMEQIEREINLIDRTLDALVYELYGLTPEEIKVVEAGQ